MSNASRSPDIEELRTFCAAAELGSIGRAAIRLHVSQPALSKRLHHLEASAGTRLLDRSRREVAKLAPHAPVELQAGGFGARLQRGEADRVRIADQLADDKPAAGPEQALG